MIIMGVIMVICGIVCVATPILTTFSLMHFFMILLFVTGITFLIESIRDRSVPNLILAILSLILGGFIGSWSDSSVGILVASVTLSIFKYGLSMMELSEANNSVVNMLVFIGFLVFQANRHLPALHKAQKARIAEAQKKKAEMAARQAA